jgi:hypothetical protein
MGGQSHSQFTYRATSRAHPTDYHMLTGEALLTLDMSWLLRSVAHFLRPLSRSSYMYTLTIMLYSVYSLDNCVFLHWVVRPKVVMSVIDLRRM